MRQKTGKGYRDSPNNEQLRQPAVRQCLNTGAVKPLADEVNIMIDDAALGDGWQVWNAAEDRVILTYRPDVFDSNEFPAPCLPTIYVTHGHRRRRPGPPRTHDPDDPWLVTLYLEPEVNHPPSEFDSRHEAITAAQDLSRDFVEGHIDYRSLYQIPRDAYLEQLDTMTEPVD